MRYADDRAAVSHSGEVYIICEVEFAHASVLTAGLRNKFEPGGTVRRRIPTMATFLLSQRVQHGPIQI